MLILPADIEPPPPTGFSPKAFFDCCHYTRAID
jgi:hypothetical protein